MNDDLPRDLKMNNLPYKLNVFEEKLLHIMKHKKMSKNGKAAQAAYTDMIITGQPAEWFADPFGVDLRVQKACRSRF
eukprot:CAMPEP_0170186018 /NCGR_PEP_ID=MMETSP0040_2-20121228/38115_1 /TAXON_ID=641309 /ORGANISM="Lotharella oceanica, Strain CCMP622" /LENGTH=76 /DNA_ID=CAMNT_0010432619 /DNA_START=15 /DNA_END=245 /DNA_ORIENTATION=+